MHDGGERGALVLLDETPVADVREPPVGDVRGDLLHGVKARLQPWARPRRRWCRSSLPGQCGFCIRLRCDVCPRSCRSRSAEDPPSTGWVKIPPAPRSVVRRRRGSARLRCPGSRGRRPAETEPEGPITGRSVDFPIGRQAHRLRGRGGRIGGAAAGRRRQRARRDQAAGYFAAFFLRSAQ